MSSSRTRGVVAITKQHYFDADAAMVHLLPGILPKDYYTTST